jgi:hypothetical protein
MIVILNITKYTNFRNVANLLQMHLIFVPQFSTIFVSKKLDMNEITPATFLDRN